jgi:hypothetical protein
MIGAVLPPPGPEEHALDFLSSLAAAVADPKSFKARVDKLAQVTAEAKAALAAAEAKERAVAEFSAASQEAFLVAKEKHTDAISQELQEHRARKELAEETIRDNEKQAAEHVAAAKADREEAARIRSELQRRAAIVTGAL